MTTFSQKKVFQSLNILEKLIMDFWKFIMTVWTRKKKNSKSFAPTLNFLSNSTSVSSSRDLPEILERSTFWSEQVSPKISTHSKSMTRQETQNTFRKRVGAKFFDATVWTIIRNLFSRREWAEKALSKFWPKDFAYSGQIILP